MAYTVETESRHLYPRLLAAGSSEMRLSRHLRELTRDILAPRFSSVRREINQGVFFSGNSKAIHDVWSLIDGYACAQEGLRSNTVTSYWAAAAFFRRTERAVESDIQPS